MKKQVPTKKYFNSRLIFKSGCYLFLLFFMFFSLTAPLVAEIGSFIFLLSGGVLAAYLYNNDPQENALPPKAAIAIYAELDPSASIVDNHRAEAAGSPDNFTVYEYIAIPNTQSNVYRVAAVFPSGFISCLLTISPLRAGPCRK